MDEDGTISEDQKANFMAVCEAEEEEKALAAMVISLIPYTDPNYFYKL